MSCFARSPTLGRVSDLKRVGSCRRIYEGRVTRTVPPPGLFVTVSTVTEVGVSVAGDNGEKGYGHASRSCRNTDVEECCVRRNTTVGAHTRVRPTNLVIVSCNDLNSAIFMQRLPAITGVGRQGINRSNITRGRTKRTRLFVDPTGLYTSRSFVTNIRFTRGAYEPGFEGSCR